MKRWSTPKLKLDKDEKGSTHSSPQQHLKFEIPVSYTASQNVAASAVKKKVLYAKVTFSW